MRRYLPWLWLVLNVIGVAMIILGDADARLADDHAKRILSRTYSDLNEQSDLRIVPAAKKNSYTSSEAETALQKSVKSALDFPSKVPISSTSGSAKSIQHDLTFSSGILQKSLGLSKDEADQINLIVQDVFRKLVAHDTERAAKESESDSGEFYKIPADIPFWRRMRSDVLEACNEITHSVEAEYITDAIVYHSLVYGVAFDRELSVVTNRQSGIESDILEVLVKDANGQLAWRETALLRAPSGYQAPISTAAPRYIPVVTALNRKSK
jgi:hypothetical protein